MGSWPGARRRVLKLKTYVLSWKSLTITVNSQRYTFVPLKAIGGALAALRKRQGLNFMLSLKIVGMFKNLFYCVLQA